MPPFTEPLRQENQGLFDTCVVRPDRVIMLGSIVARVRRGEAIYAQISAATGVPWHVVGMLHQMESDCNFDAHLHNGDPLSARTVHEPPDRPPGPPPFTFEQSAVDALQLEGFTASTDWSIPGTLYCFEKYNGFGYRKHEVHSPYVWGGSNHYTAGRYVADGQWSPTSVSQRVGAGVVLLRFVQLGLVDVDVKVARVTAGADRLSDARLVRTPSA